MAPDHFIYVKNLGIYGIMVMGIGIIISGIFILKKNPNARAVAAWISFTALAYAIGKPKFTLYLDTKRY